MPWSTAANPKVVTASQPGPTRSKVRVVGAKGVDPGRGDDEMQHAEGDAAPAAGREPTPEHDVEQTAGQTGEQTPEHVEAEGPIETDAANHLLRLGELSLSVIARRDGEQAHDQANCRSGREGTGPEPADERDGNPARVADGHPPGGWPS